MTQPSKTTSIITALHSSEAGFISVVNVVAILLCTILMGLVVNAGNIVRHKVEVQNSADATAYTAALWHARGMNAVTMANHVMGEINAFVVLHEAIGGEDLDDTNQKEATQAEDAALEVAYNLAQSAAIAPQDEVYDTVRQEDGIEAERTLLDSKTQLKIILTVAYGGKAVAAVLEAIPYTYAVGIALDIAATAVELKVYQEYMVLKGIHLIASGLKPVSQALQKVVLPAVKGYTVVVQGGIPAVGLAAAKEVAERNDTTGFVALPNLMLPLEADPVGEDLTSDSSDADVAKTQFVRATYPWVTFHRKPILDFMRNWLTFSGAQGFYETHTNECTIVVSRRLQVDGIMELLMMANVKDPDKGYEDWTTDSQAADNMFTMVGFAHRERPPVISPVVYTQSQEDGMVNFSQAMFYNANPQEPLQSVQSRQAALGWDTLNWQDRPVECPTDERSTGFPTIRLNWQAKLVPVTNNRMLTAQPTAMVQEPFRSVLERTVSASPMVHH
ncbi:hypothetical protein Pan258_32550 [Symmachiella dynata]|uniref:Tad domain-containing protein n=1 Tax=Symmachiella dynata TaxID=2527995 RepID=UPI001187B290|nr:Tad domain-containing protein [Symmachiella dynata]QDT49208.1 hypothetical protein Pan258_32550 [Symmachiella dynata]